MAQGVQPATHAVRCLLMPLREARLLVPGAAVAEIAGWQEPEPIQGAPAWVLGRIAWRGIPLPLVDIEGLAGDASQVGGGGRRARVAVLHGAPGDERLPFYGLLLQGIPHLVQVFPGLVSPDTQAGGLSHAVIAQNVVVHGERAFIPDLEVLERSLREALGLGTAG